MRGDGGGIVHGDLLVQFTEAVVDQRSADLERLRGLVRSTMGDDALVDAAAVIATFEATDRMADATGTSLEDYKREATTTLRAELGINAWDDV